MAKEAGYYKFELDVPSTLNKVHSKPINLTTSKGNSFYVEKLWIAAVMDAIAAADQLILQFSTKSQNGEAAVYDIESEYEIMTECLDYHLAEAAITNLKDPTIEVELVNFRDLMLPKEFYMNLLVLGQAGATASASIKIKGNYMDKTLDPDYHNRTL